MLQQARGLASRHGWSGYHGGGGFNLDAIIAVGEALRSPTARRFRRWTNHYVYASDQRFDAAHLVAAIRDRVEEQPRDLVATKLVKHDFRKRE